MERGRSPRSNIGRCLATLGMTVLMISFILGKVRKGDFPLSTICHSEPILRGASSLNRGGEQTLLELHPKAKTEEMSHFVRHDDKWRRDKSPSQTPPKINFCRFGVSWEGGLYPFSLFVTPKCRSEGSPLFNRGGQSPPLTLPKNDFMPLGKS